MQPKKLKRITRTARLTPEESARDEELRKKIREEFPPAPPAHPEVGAIGDALRTAIKTSSKSVYQICKDAGISQIVVSRFLSGERDIRLATADRLAAVLGIMATSPGAPSR